MYELHGKACYRMRPIDHSMSIAISPATTLFPVDHVLVSEIAGQEAWILSFAKKLLSWQYMVSLVKSGPWRVATATVILLMALQEGDVEPCLTRVPC